MLDTVTKESRIYRKIVDKTKGPSTDHITVRPLIMGVCFF